MHVEQYQNMASLYSDLNVRKLKSGAATLCLLQALAEGKVIGLFTCTWVQTCAHEFQLDMREWLCAIT